MWNWLLVLAALVATPASADEMNAPFLRGNWFVRNCDSSTWKLACASYILGYFHGSQTREKTACLPDGVDNRQLWEVALAYMRVHPERGHIVGTILLDEAWQSAFPCERR